MKILTAAQFREADKFTIENESISSLDLMERAANACLNDILTVFHKKNFSHIKIMCGVGNNGGDGLTIARLLTEKNIRVEIFVVHFSENRSEDFKTNLSRIIKLNLPVTGIHKKSDIPVFEPADYVIDALFGTGLTRSVDGVAKEVVQSINKSGAFVVAIDMPSGLYTEDNDSNDLDAVIKANITLTFELPKLAFLFSENDQFVGDWRLVSIGLNESFISKLTTNLHLTTLKDLKSLIKPRSKFSHKGTYGHVMLVAGSYGKIGAAVLAAKSCLRSGVGLVSIHSPTCGYEILQTSVPEAMVFTDSNERVISEQLQCENYSAVGIGPGIGIEEDTERALKLYIQNCNCSLVLDADALNILSENKTWLSFLPPNTILTPHVKEFDRLFGASSTSYQRFLLQIDISKKYNMIIVLKGAHTSISFSNGTAYFNTTGNPGIAKGGSGDVLTGLITGLLGQGYKNETAALLGVYLHGLSGNLAAAKLGQYGMNASDLIDFLPHAFNFLQFSENNN